jgi:hypothetical protein
LNISQKSTKKKFGKQIVAFNVILFINILGNRKMNIKEIKTPAPQNFEYQSFKPINIDKKEVSEIFPTEKNVIFDKNDIAKSQNWQQEILLQGLEALENKIQMVNNDNILDKAENKPIETFAEALHELAKIKTDIFKKEASAAQANISPEVVFELLTEFA